MSNLEKCKKKTKKKAKIDSNGKENKKRGGNIFIKVSTFLWNIVNKRKLEKKKSV